MSYLEDETENAWASEKSHPAEATAALDTLTLEDSGGLLRLARVFAALLTLSCTSVWNSRANTPSPVVPLNSQRALIDDFGSSFHSLSNARFKSFFADPYGHASSSPASSVSQPNEEAPVAVKELVKPSLLPPAPLLPSLSFSSLTNVFKRSTPISTPPRSSTPEASTSKVLQQIDEKAPLRKTAEVRAAATHAEDVAFDFNRFMDQMRSKYAEPIAKYLRS
jgi:hypothetical protein